MSATGHEPEIDFVTFVMSLAASALLHLGEHEQGTAAGPVDLPLAKQTIDIIGMLREKTRGNLSVEEDRLIETALYDLRLKFLHASKKS
ncbi:MAG: DUF1844 domain-containing protein [Myxococcales bacterium]|jgi:hypothetical protein|nr:DUF1844 domain-containing protein [Myxococcales bacterium]